MRVYAIFAALLMFSGCARELQIREQEQLQAPSAVMALSTPTPIVVAQPETAAAPTEEPPPDVEDQSIVAELVPIAKEEVPQDPPGTIDTRYPETYTGITFAIESPWTPTRPVVPFAGIVPPQTSGDLAVLPAGTIYLPHETVLSGEPGETILLFTCLTLQNDNRRLLVLAVAEGSNASHELQNPPSLFIVHSQSYRAGAVNQQGQPIGGHVDLGQVFVEQAVTEGWQPEQVHEVPGTVIMRGADGKELRYRIVRGMRVDYPAGPINTGQSDAYGSQLVQAAQGQ